MRKKIWMFLFVLSIMACSKEGTDPYTYDQETIYSISYDTHFSELVSFISPYILDKNGEKKYIVTEKLTDIHVSINDRTWDTDNSYMIDTSKITDQEQIGDFRVTSEPVAYPVVVGINLRPEELDTAGEYATLIKNYYYLSPGVYVCQIESFTFTTLSGQNRTIYTPTTYTTVEVKEGEVSSSIGTFEVLIEP